METESACLCVQLLPSPHSFVSKFARTVFSRLILVYLCNCKIVFVFLCVRLCYIASCTGTLLCAKFVRPILQTKKNSWTGSYCCCCCYIRPTKKYFLEWSLTILILAPLPLRPQSVWGNNKVENGTQLVPRFVKTYFICKNIFTNLDECIFNFDKIGFGSFLFQFSSNSHLVEEWDTTGAKVWQNVSIVPLNSRHLMSLNI